MRETKTPHTADNLIKEIYTTKFVFKGMDVITANQENLQNAKPGSPKIHSQEKSKMIQYSHKVERNTSTKTTKGMKKMQTEKLIVASPRTNTIYLSETSARDVRNPNIPEARELFLHFLELLPTAEVVCLSDKDFIDMFQEANIQSLKNMQAKNVLSIDNPERPIMHFEKIA